jgi:hypothetical protein
MGRKRKSLQDKANASHSENEEPHSVFDMAHYEPKKFKKAKRRSEKSVYSNFKTKKTKKIDWI